MAGNLVSIGNNGVAAGSQQLNRSGSERQGQRELSELGKALSTNDIATAKIAFETFKSATAPAENGRTDFQNAVKALDQALKADDAKGATAALNDLQAGARRGPQRQGVPAEQTRARQQEGESRQVAQSSRQDFITRQDLAAQAASNAGPVERPGNGIGRLIDVKA